MKKIIISGIVMAVATLPCLPVKGQGKVVPFKYGNMDHWVVRNIKESGIIGGNQKTVYAVGPNMTVNGNIPYTNKGGSPWGSSNVLAHVSGIYKTNNSVFRDKHGSGYCAKLVTHIEKVKVLGLINIKVLAAGSLFLGNVREPITSTKDGPKAINHSPHVLRLCALIIRLLFLMQPIVSSRMDLAEPLRLQVEIML